MCVYYCSTYKLFAFDQRQAFGNSIFGELCNLLPCGGLPRDLISLCNIPNRQYGGTKLVPNLVPTLVRFTSSCIKTSSQKVGHSSFERRRRCSHQAFSLDGWLCHARRQGLPGLRCRSVCGRYASAPTDKRAACRMLTRRGCVKISVARATSVCCDGLLYA